MLSNDGKYTIYIIEFKGTGEKWCKLSFDAAWFTPEIYESKRELFNQFSASGKCWQETGVHGTYEVEDAIKLYCLLRQHGIKQEYACRVNQKIISQDSNILWCG